MIWFILALVVTVGTFLIFTFIEDLEEGIFSLLGAGFISGVVAIGLNGFIFLCHSSGPPDNIRNVYAIEQLPGSNRYVAMDYADDEVEYSIRVEANGGYYTKVVEYYVDEVGIVEDDNEKPRVEEWECIVGDNYWWTIFTSTNICQRTLFVPEGSVTK